MAGPQNTFQPVLWAENGSVTDLADPLTRPEELFVVSINSSNESVGYNNNNFVNDRYSGSAVEWLATGQATLAPSAGMAVHRMARGRKRADEILAFDPARRHAHRRSRRHGQIALAHRARLRGTQKRARPRPFRRAKLARIPSPRRPLHRRLRFSHPRTSGDSPLRPPAAPNVSPILTSQTQRLRQSDPNDMSKIRSRRSEDSSRSRSPAPSCAARVAKPCHHDDPTGDHRD